MTLNPNNPNKEFLDDNEATPSSSPKPRNPSQFLCSPFTHVHTTPKRKQRAKKKVATRSTPPPRIVFAVDHDFSVLRLQINTPARPVFADITMWIRLLMERRFEADRYTIMPPNFFVCRLLEDVNDWRAFISGIDTYPDIMVPWWDVDKLYY
uniref:Uncharacterized protein n=1 Tax=Lactuca sativa TaxID=4236 RepID=A0A9R1W949_LACSA|nr:hypothetical protein LSAT_V11C300152210 [Lactuca sativa]